jgi:hypothetical protein
MSSDIGATERIGLRIELIANGTLLDDDTIAALADAPKRYDQLRFQTKACK